MKCAKCQAILPPHYNKCPVCGYGKLIPEQFKKQEVEDVEYEPVSPYVIGGDLDDYEAGE